jgi:hypothetical protein
MQGQLAGFMNTAWEYSVPTMRNHLRHEHGFPVTFRQIYVLTVQAVNKICSLVSWESNGNFLI